MKRFNIKLSVPSINMAIRRLKDYKDDFDDNVLEIVDILTNDGAEEAQSKYADYPVEAVPYVDGNQGEITVIGDMPAIAEFGAGDAVVRTDFENLPEEIRRSSYSEQHARQYSRWGFWYFGGEVYYEVPGHHGLLAAKRHIMEHSTEVAKEVFSND